MFCKNCGNRMLPTNAYCSNCGTAKGKGMRYCPACGQSTRPGIRHCPACGCTLGAAATDTHRTNQRKQQQYTPHDGVPCCTPTAAPIGRSRLAAGLFGVFLGGLGVHNFYMGYIGRGIAQIILSVFTCGLGSIWGLIEGVWILAGSPKTDANKIPLQD